MEADNALYFQFRTKHNGSAHLDWPEMLSCAAIVFLKGSCESSTLLYKIGFLA